MYQDIINNQEAVKHLADDNWLFIDCRFNLDSPNQGLADYQSAHVPGAVYADLNLDLSGEIIPGETGRHPLPTQKELIEKFSRWGITPETQVVAYDESNGSMAAARLWWLLKWAGHEATAVLNGGLKIWKENKFPCSSGIETKAYKKFIPNFNSKMVANAEKVFSVISNPSFTLVDSRKADRYQGKNETRDAIAGHIPGAISDPYSENTEPNGLFKNPDKLKERFDKITSNKNPVNIIFYCGSGVNAAQNILSFYYATKKMPALYVGSWSDWVTDKNKPVET